MRNVLTVILILLLATSLVFAVDKVKVSKERMNVAIDPNVITQDVKVKTPHAKVANVPYGPGTFLFDNGYDYLGNGNAPRGIVNYGDGTMVVCRMGAALESLADRGSWYSFFDGSTWSPIVKVEALRRGWTDLDVFKDDGREVVVSHTGNEVNVDALKGFGLWTSSLTGNIPAALGGGHIWPRMAVDYQGNIHIVSSLQAAVAGARFGTYYPVHTWSTDGGTTFQHQWIYGDPFTTLDTTDGQWTGFNIDDYPVDACGLTGVATMSVPRNGNGLADIWIAESLDNGATWAPKNITNFTALPAAGVDEFRPTQGVDLAYDNECKIHVITTNWLVRLDSAGTGADLYDAQSAPMRHWSEATGWVDICTFQNLPGYNPAENIFDGDALNFGLGNCTILQSPSIGFDAAGNMFVMFAAISPVDTLADGSNFSDVYVVGSKDNGATWGPVVNVSNYDGKNPNMEDCDVSLAELVDDNLHIVYHSDPQIGNNSASGAAPFRTNLMYYAFPKANVPLISGVEPIAPVEVAGTFALLQNYPNPFNPTTNITFELKSAAKVNLSIYDINGKLVATVVDGKMAAGKHKATWNAQNMTSGVYFAKLSSEGITAVKKMVLVQ